MRIAVASDQSGREAKQRLIARLSAAGHEVVDPATALDDHERSDYAEQVALAVLRHDTERGIILTSRGVGASVIANRVPGIRAALCNDPVSAHHGAKTEGMNLLVLSVHAVTSEQIDQVVDAYLEATLAPVEVVGGLTPRRLQRVFEHVRENISQELSVAQLSQVVGMSQYYFSKLFKMSTGTTPHQYVMRQRVERAQELLRETRTPLLEVASKVGFETQSHFTSVFRHMLGITPKRYREMNRSGAQMEVLENPEQAKSGEAGQKSATAA